MKHMFKRRLALAMALTGSLSLLPVTASAAGTVSYEAPTSGMTASKEHITGATAAANTVLLSVLGIDITASNTAGVYDGGGSTDTYGTDSSNLGIFGSDINDSPDPYLYNYFYNLYSTKTAADAKDYSDEAFQAWTATPFSLIWDSNKSGPTGQASGTVTITQSGVTKTTNTAFFYEPDVLLGGTSNGYATELENYQAEYNEDYDPTIFLGYNTGIGYYAASGTRSDGLGLAYNQFDMCSGVVYLGAVVQNLMAETGKINRYDQGAYEIAVNYDKYDRGLYYYILSQIADGSLTKVRYASSLSYDADTQYYTVSLGTARNAQYADGIGTDIYDLLENGYQFADGSTVQKTEASSSTGNNGNAGGPGSGGPGGGGPGGGGAGGAGGSTAASGYQLTKEQLVEILNVPASENPVATGVVLVSGNNTLDPTGYLEDNGIRFLGNLPSCVYGMTMQTVENGMGIPFYAGFFYYNQDESLNPINYIYYWMENFYHVSDNTAMETVVRNMLDGADLPEGLGLAGAQVSDYNSSVIEKQITDGIAYYQNVLKPQYDADSTIAADSSIYWKTLDTTVGIGSNVHNTNTDYTFTSTARTGEDGSVQTDIHGNILYDFTFTRIAGENPFDDIDTNDYYYEAACWALENDIITGRSTTESGQIVFDPDGSCIRGDVVTFLYRVAGEPSVDGLTNPFTDVDSSAYYYNAILWAVKQGIIKGITPTTFDPSSTCSREQVITLLYRAAGEPAVTESTTSFSDVKATDYFYNAVLWADQQGIFDDASDGVFGSGSVCARRDIVTFIYRAQT